MVNRALNCRSVKSTGWDNLLDFFFFFWCDSHRRSDRNASKCGPQYGPHMTECDMLVGAYLPYLTNKPELIIIIKRCGWMQMCLFFFYFITT